MNETTLYLLCSGKVVFGLRYESQEGLNQIKILGMRILGNKQSKFK